MPYIGWLGGGFAAALVFELIYAIVMIVGGIVGIVYCGRPDKGNTVFMLGIVIVVLRIIDWILASAMFSGLIDVVNASSVILGFIVPILLAVGGYLNKKAA